MQKSFIVMILAMAVITINCGKKKGEEGAQPAAPAASTEVKYSKYSASIYKEPGKTWVAALNKAEDVTVVKTETVKNKQFSFVKTSGGKEGYIDATYLSGKPFVVIDPKISVYASPTVTGKVTGKMPRGTVGFLVEEKGQWIKIQVGNVSESYNYTKDAEGKKYVDVVWVNNDWIESTGISYDLKLVSQAVEIEPLITNFFDQDKDKQEKAGDALRKIKDDSSHPFSRVACIVVTGAADYCPIEPPRGEGGHG